MRENGERERKRIETECNRERERENVGKKTRLIRNHTCRAFVHAGMGISSSVITDQARTGVQQPFALSGTMICGWISLKNIEIIRNLEDTTKKKI